MRARIRQMFRVGTLDPSSPLQEVPYIGPFLSTGLRRRLGMRRDTLRAFARSMSGLPSARAIREELQIALQNRRANRCVDGYHVSDVNERGYSAMLALVRVLCAGEDGHGLWRGRALPLASLRCAPRRTIDTRRVACEPSRAACRARGGAYGDRQCHPTSARARGFPGVAGWSGQRASANRRRRGAYAQSPTSAARWRRPGRLPVVR